MITGDTEVDKNIAIGFLCIMVISLIGAVLSTVSWYADRKSERIDKEREREVD